MAVVVVGWYGSEELRGESGEDGAGNGASDPSHGRRLGGASHVCAWTGRVCVGLGVGGAHVFVGNSKTPSINADIYSNLCGARAPPSARTAGASGAGIMSVV